MAAAQGLVIECLLHRIAVMEAIATNSIVSSLELLQEKNNELVFSDSQLAP